MNQYHKIYNVFLRDPGNNHRTLIDGAWGRPEFEALKDIEWTWTEKIDGTNIRVMWDGEDLTFGGKTDNAQIPSHLVNELRSMFSEDEMRDKFDPGDGGQVEVCLYGEGYGYKIQKGGNYIPGKCSFILFDIKIGDWWLKREDVVDIANELGLEVVPLIGTGPLQKAVDLVKKGFVSEISHNRDYIAEGLIVKPCIDLFSRNGERIVAKIKHKDFA